MFRIPNCYLIVCSLSLGVVLWIVPIMAALLKDSCMFTIGKQNFFTVNNASFHDIVSWDRAKRVKRQLYDKQGQNAFLDPERSSHFRSIVVTFFHGWRLQRSFNHKEGKGRTGCSGINLRDICSLLTCVSRNEQERAVNSKPLTLADLKGMKPEYLSNIVVNRWRSHEGQKKYSLLNMSPSGI